MLLSTTKIKPLEQNYTFKEKIGKGSFGQVGKWINKADGKIYAIKVIQVNRLYMDAIADEANHLEATKSDYILQLIDHFYDDSQSSYILITPYYKLGSFEQLVKNPWGLDETLLFFYQISKALQDLAQQQICHLDLKPDNILIKAPGQYILCDLGCARKLENKNNQSYNMLRISTNSKGGGTTQYASPELILYSEMTTYTDVWSLGIILYKMIYKKHPLMTTPGMYHKIIEDFHEGVIHISYPRHEELQSIVNIIKKMLRPVNEKSGRRMKWSEIVNEIRKLLGISQDLKINIITNIDDLQVYCDDVAIIISALLYFIKLNQELLEKQGINAQKLLKESCIYLLTLTKEINLLLKETPEEFGIFYIFQTTRKNITKKQKVYDSYLIKQAQILADQNNIPIEYGSVILSYESFLNECGKLYKKISKIKPEGLPIRNRWHKISEIISFIFFENHLEFQKRKQLRQFCEKLIYA